MKKIKFQLFLLFGLAFQAINAQQIAYNFGLRFRDQDIKQYTSIFVSSPVANQMLGAVTGPYQSGEGVNTNRYWQFVNGAYQLITVLNASTTPMVPGRGYVIQRGGIGVPPGDPTALFSICHQDYNSGGATNIIDTPVQIIGGMFNLIGNPYLGYLDVDAFLLDPANVNLVTGPLRLWAHNTIVSSGNPPDPNNPDTSTYTNSANDFALYNVLGGVAAGRYISTSNENETFTGVQTPNGKLGFGTGFLIAGLASGNAVFKPSMSSATDNGGENQSYRGILANTNTHERTENSEPTPNTTPQALALPTKNRLWVNIEKGIPPTSGINYNQLKQLLVGYIEGATIADNDRVYDAETVTVQPKIEFYSLAPISTGSTKHLAIQGRGNSDFFGSDYFQLGYTVTESGDYTFTANGDGIFTPQSGKPYFLWDNGVLHDFPYTATGLVGGVNNETRFRIVFAQKTLSIKLNIEGYYDTSTNLMRTVKTNQGISTSSLDEVDDLVIELRNALTPSTVEFQELNAILYTNGYTGIQFPNLAAGSYYVVVKHRNAIQTWSANPVQVADILFYDFTTAASQAYGSNQIEVEPGVFAFYSGDINQDESVDNSDSDLLFDDINNSNYGYLATDLNGDGSVDNSELDFFIPNSINSIYSMHP